MSLLLAYIAAQLNCPRYASEHSVKLEVILTSLKSSLTESSRYREMFDSERGMPCVAESTEVLATSSLSLAIAGAP